VIEPREAARLILDGLDGDNFLVLTHPEVARFEEVRATDRDLWLAGMRRARSALLERIGE
jgi:hypothetical protein